MSQQPTEDASTPTPPPEADLVPRPSKMRYVAIFFAGLLVGRLASENFAPGPLDAIDLFMYLGLAFSLAWAWRSWARRAMIQRRLDAERRRGRQARQPSATPRDRDEGSPEPDQPKGPPRRRRARRR